MKYAGFFRRLVANLIDSIILFIPSAMLGSSLQSISGSLAFGLFIGVFYYPIFESSELKGTPGKAIMGIVVLSEAGEKISFKAALIRYFCRYLSMMILYIGYLMQLFTSKRQTLHDMLSESVVVNQELPDLNYFTVWKSQFKEVVGKL
jgi:uncharacterized RDD family membrane protein YckC